MFYYLQIIMSNIKINVTALVTFKNLLLILIYNYSRIHLGILNSWEIVELLKKKGGDIMSKKDFLIPSLIIIIFSLLTLLFVVLI